MTVYLATIFLLSLGLGTTLTFMSSHWLLAWMGLEINTLAIIPLMAQQHHPRAVEATTKYFLVQASAAALILFASINNTWLTGQWQIMQGTHPTTTTLMIIALALKMGLAPMHFWLPGVLQGLNLTTGLILTTWQKLAPIALMMQVIPSANPMIITSLAILSTLIGGWGGLNQTQLRKILAYSSIAHMGWMVIIMQASPQLTTLVLAIYIISTATIFLTMKTINTTMLPSLMISAKKSQTLTAIAMLTLLSLAGLPPLTGFMPKWMVIQMLSEQNLPATATIMALSALISLYFYLRLCYAIILTTSPNTSNSPAPWRLPQQKTTLPLTMLMTLSLLLLPLTPTMVSFIS
uniref:NADH-ubiquinone oxidoreductase chain 2 n=1 Tax=Phractolaemus ansorgii TaxID=169291 RepID=Q2A0E2_9TELE|nr:NADH dehydrogenase subunit 2 [Phractolaemus ansorgii]BAE79995.1 NADH dehydrogenase subunit 2 [Phractolaemus ansorgii]BAF74010.1 NADH dehydrogenase subunit 2 [Phractolaemus ansorgii]